MHTTVQKWGNSLAVRIPKEYIKEIKLHQGSEVEIKREKNVISISPIRKMTNLKKLEKLLENVDKSKVHPETNWGKREGNEVW